MTLTGELTAEEMSDLAVGKLRKKKDTLHQALVGKMTEHHTFMIRTSIGHIRSIEKLVSDIDKQIDEKLKPYQKEYELLQSIPGVKEHAAASIIAEIGVNREQFPTADHLSSWAGMSPGNNETAGKKKAGKTTHGSKALKSTLTESAWVASRTKHCYLNAKYHSLVGRRGKKRALIAVGHKMLVMIYHILKHKIPYKELGIDYLDKRRKDKITKSYIKRLTALGFKVTIKEAA